jgi:large subunit ribosomal protein L6
LDKLNKIKPEDIRFMSRVGKKAIEIPEDVFVSLTPETVIVKGKYGTLEQPLVNFLKIEVLPKKIYVTRNEETQKAREFHGLIRALLQNMVLGVNKKFSKTLIAEGVGYKFQLDKKVLIVNVGFTHPVKFQIPSDLEIKLESPVKISITGINKETVGFLAAKIREVKPPEPYKGKGILYEGEIVRRKAGKTGK